MSSQKGPIYLRKRGGVWHFRVTSWKDYKTTGKRNRIEAQAHALDVYKKIQEGTLEDSEKPLETFASEYYGPNCPIEDSRRAAGKTAGIKYIKRCRDILEDRILTDKIAKVPVGELRRQHVLDFRQRLTKKMGYTRGAAVVMQVLGSILREMHYREILPRDVMNGIKRMNVETKPRDRFSPDELEALFGQRPGPFLNSQVYDLFYFALTTGMRRGEILCLKWIDVDLVNGLITVQRALKNVGGKSYEGPPKNGKSRITPLIPNAREVLLRQPNNGAYVFSYPDGRPLSPVLWIRNFPRALKNAGITRPGLTAHSLRHTFNSLLLDQGIPAEIIRAALGWSGQDIQSRYTHIGPESFGCVEILVVDPL